MAATAATPPVQVTPRRPPRPQTGPLAASTEIGVRAEREPTLASSSDGLTALAITLIVYGLAELCHAYGFLAVFVAALVVRQRERHTTTTPCSTPSPSSARSC